MHSLTGFWITIASRHLVATNTKLLEEPILILISIDVNKKKCSKLIHSTLKSIKENMSLKRLP